MVSAVQERAGECQSRPSVDGGASRGVSVVLVQGDEVGLLIEHEGWICRPVTETSLAVGQACHAKLLYGQSVSIMSGADPAHLIDVWMRCGRAADQRTPVDRAGSAQASARFAEDVWWLREMALVGKRMRADLARGRACVELATGESHESRQAPRCG